MRVLTQLPYGHYDVTISEGVVSEMGAAEFKAHCLQVMERVRRTRQEVVITKRGVPVAKLVPPDPPRNGSVFGCLAAETTIVGDVLAPLYTDADWQAWEQEREDQFLRGESKPPTTRKPKRTGRPPK